MRTMKYVLNSESGRFVFIPDIGMVHSDVLGNWTNAGFVSFDTSEKDDCGNVIIKPKCYGESVSLGLSCGENDDEIIYRGIKDLW